MGHKRRPGKLAYIEASGDGWRASVWNPALKKRVKGSVHRGEDARQRAHEDAIAFMKKLEAGGTEAVSMAAPETKEPPRLDEALAMVLRECERRERRAGTAEFYQNHGGSILRHFGARTCVDQIGEDEEVQAFIDASRKAGLSGTTVRHHLQVLKRLLRVAGAWTPRVAMWWPKLVVPKASKRSLELRMAWEEATAAIGKLQGIERAIMTFVAGTGVRRTEMARMEKKHLDLKGKRVVVPVGKIEPRELPMPDSALPTLRAIVEGTRGPWFAEGEQESQRVDWLQAKSVAARHVSGEPRLQLHELRRVFASRIASQFSVPIVAALLGHALPGVVGSYVHADKKALTEAMAFVWRDLVPG